MIWKDLNWVELGAKKSCQEEWKLQEVEKTVVGNRKVKGGMLLCGMYGQCTL